MKNKPIIATNVSTNEMRLFDSVSIASKTLGISRSNINNVLNGKKTDANGYTFKEYKECHHDISENNHIDTNTQNSSSSSVVVTEETLIPNTNNDIINVPMVENVHEQLSTDITSTVINLQQVVETTQTNLQQVHQEIQKDIEVLHDDIQCIQDITMKLHEQKEPVNVDDWKYKTRIMIINLIYNIKQCTNIIANYIKHKCKQLTEYLCHIVHHLF